MNKASNVILFVKFLGARIPVTWDGEVAGNRRCVGHPVIDGNKCSNITVHFMPADISGYVGTKGPSMAS